MAVCKYCGAWIDWIRTPAGKYMPVGPRPVLIMPDRGAETFITDEGEIVRGQRTLPGAVGGRNIAAYVPHWAHCPARGKKGANHETL